MAHHRYSRKPPKDPTKLQLAVTLLAGLAAFVVLFVHFYL